MGPSHGFHTPAGQWVSAGLPHQPAQTCDFLPSSRQRRQESRLENRGAPSSLYHLDLALTGAKFNRRCRLACDLHHDGMAPRQQSTFTVVPNPLGMQGLLSRPTGTGPQSKPPMTSKQAQQLHRKATKGPRLSKAELRRIELEEQARIRKEIEKEKQSFKARAAREKKKAKEQQVQENKRKKGLPLVDVRPSQDTIARFVRKSTPLDKKRDSVAAQLETVREEEDGPDKENQPPPEKRQCVQATSVEPDLGGAIEGSKISVEKGKGTSAERPASQRPCDQLSKPSQKNVEVAEPVPGSPVVIPPPQVPPLPLVVPKSQSQSRSLQPHVPTSQKPLVIPVVSTPSSRGSAKLVPPSSKPRSEPQPPVQSLLSAPPAQATLPPPARASGASISNRGTPRPAGKGPAVFLTPILPAAVPKSATPSSVFKPARPAVTYPAPAFRPPPMARTGTPSFELQKPRFLPRHLGPTAVRRPPALVPTGKEQQQKVTGKGGLEAEAPPTSTQAFLATYIDEILPTTSQLVRELEEPTSTTPMAPKPVPSKPTVLKPAMPKPVMSEPAIPKPAVLKPATPRAMVSESAVPKLALRRLARPPLAPPAKPLAPPPRPWAQQQWVPAYPNPPKLSTDIFTAFISTQDCVLSSQDLEEITETPPKTARKVSNKRAGHYSQFISTPLTGVLSAKPTVSHATGRQLKGTNTITKQPQGGSSIKPPRRGHAQDVPSGHGPKITAPSTTSAPIHARAPNAHGDPVIDFSGLDFIGSAVDDLCNEDYDF